MKNPMNGDNVVKSRRAKQFWSRVLVWSLVAATIFAIIFSATNYVQGQRSQAAIEQLGANYEQIRAQKIDLCALKANSAKPECLSTGLPAKTIVNNTIEKAVPIPGIPGPIGLTGSVGPMGPSPSPAFLAALAERAHLNFCSTGVCVPEDGTDGVKGDKGDQGDSIVGPKGDSIKGDKGQSAYPFTFTFTTPEGRTYTCSLPEAGETGTCVMAPTPTPEPTPAP